MTELERETLITCVEYIGQIDNKIEEMDSKSSNDEFVLEKQLLAQMLEGFEWINEVLVLTKEYHEIQFSDLNQTYEELLEAIQDEDNLVIMDLLVYEIKPVLVQWKAKLIGLL